MSAPTPLTEVELVRQLCTHAESTLARADHQIDRLSAELAATKSCLAAANERIGAQDKLIEGVSDEFRALDNQLCAPLVRTAIEALPDMVDWGITGPLMRLRGFLNIRSKPRPATGPRLQLLGPLGPTDNVPEKGAAHAEK